jgi:hypothetical protein
MNDEADDGRQASRVQTFDLIVRENVAEDEQCRIHRDGLVIA